MGYTDEAAAKKGLATLETEWPNRRKRFRFLNLSLTMPDTALKTQLSDSY